MIFLHSDCSSCWRILAHKKQITTTDSVPIQYFLAQDLHRISDYIWEKKLYLSEANSFLGFYIQHLQILKQKNLLGILGSF